MISRKIVKKFFQKSRKFRQQLFRVSSTGYQRLFFKHIVQRCIVGSLTSNGQKSKALRIFYDTIRYLRFSCRIQRPIDFIFNAIIKFRPFFSVRLLRKGGSFYKVPAPITFKRSLLQVFGWFRRSVKARKERFYHERFIGELNSLLKFTGETYKQYKMYHASALQNRSLMRRALIPYRPLKMRRRFRRKNYLFRNLRRKRKIQMYGFRLRNRYVRRRYHSLFVSFRRLWYYMFFFKKKNMLDLKTNLQSKQILRYLFFIHKKLITHLLYRQALPYLKLSIKRYFKKFFFTQKLRFSTFSRLFNTTFFYRQLQIYRTSHIRLFFYKTFSRASAIPSSNLYFTKYNFFTKKKFFDLKSSLRHQKKMFSDKKFSVLRKRRRISRKTDRRTVWQARTKRKVLSKNLSFDYKSPLKPHSSMFSAKKKSSYLRSSGFSSRKKYI